MLLLRNGRWRGHTPAATLVRLTSLPTHGRAGKTRKRLDNCLKKKGSETLVHISLGRICVSAQRRGSLKLGIPTQKDSGGVWADKQET